MIPKRFEDISKADIDTLVTNSVPEGRALDYKRTLPGGKDDEKREFLADVSSFANAAGGDIIFGVEEDQGVPTVATGLQGIDPDAEILRLDNCVRTGIEPRVPAVQIKKVDGFPAGPVMVLRVPKSWSSPHMVTFKGSSRFFSRTNAGKFQLDVTEIRSAFLMSEELPERIRRFRDDRLIKIVADEAPVKLFAVSRVVLHVVPFTSFTAPPAFDVARVPSHRLPPLGADAGWSHRLNLDGLVNFSGGEGNDKKFGYMQLFRNGVIEAAEAIAYDLDCKPIAYIGPRYEVEIVSRLSMYFEFLHALDVSPPVWIGMAMTSVKGLRMHTRSAGISYSPGIDREVIILPDIVVEDFLAKPEDFMKPSFDAVWQAAGHHRSYSYNEQGRWAPQY